ncbi:MAG TPA: redoxin domain-containing protein, partial [Armatimonadota bacterium]|nr:redoxin domain-containing protein [Armatimonadota bacterium]
LLFIGSTCPAANRDLPVANQLAARYAPRGVRFLAVHAGQEETLAEIAAHAREFHLSFPALKDDGQQLARSLTAGTTPEAFLLDSESTVRYRGSIGAQDGPLSQALDQLLAGKPVARPVTPVAGCTIALAETTPAPAPAAVDYHRNIAPILQQHCESCHRSGQAAPFTLQSYADARRHAEDIRRLTQKRTMPPWLAEPGHGEFEDVRRLTDAELSTLAQWVDAGTPEGDPTTGPPAREWSSEWKLGKPDLVLTPSEAYPVGASGDDEFRVFVLPTDFAEDRQIAGLEFRPGNPRVVHHMALLVDTSGRGRELDQQEAGVGYSSGPGGVRIDSAVLLGLWTPGTSPRLLPAGVGRPLPKGADLLLQVHYHRSGKPETDRSQIGIHFARTETHRTAMT